MQWYWIITVVLVVVSVGLHFAGVVRFDTTLPWTAWLVAALVLLNGGWMAFDGGKALITGDYVTPTTGQYAGSLGPWSKLVSAVGMAPRSTLMKSIFLTYGIAYVLVTAALLLGRPSAWWGVLVAAALGLWYIPFGSLINIVVIILLLVPPLRSVVLPS